MVGMPDWFAKTKEMVAADHWFSLDGAGSEADLIKRYEDALISICKHTDDEYPKNADALQRTLWAACVRRSALRRRLDPLPLLPTPRSTAASAATSGR